MKKVLRMFGLFVLFAGMGILTMGVYFAVAKAGLPYQNPTEIMQAEYEAFEEAGKICIWTGAVSIVGGIVFMLLSLKKKKKKEAAGKKEIQEQG